jgi:hypothetical protein
VQSSIEPFDCAPFESLRVFDRIYDRIYDREHGAESTERKPTISETHNAQGRQSPMSRTKSSIEHGAQSVEPRTKSNDP